MPSTARWQPHPDHKGVQVRHASNCPRNLDPTKRCRTDKGCVPKYRRRLWDAEQGKPYYSPSTAVVSEAIGASHDAAARAAVVARETSRELGDVAIEWWWRFKAGRVPKRRGSGLPSDTTINGYRPLLFKTGRNAEPREWPIDDEVKGLLLLEWGHRRGDEITERELQSWVDNLRSESGELLSRSRITEILAVLRGVYAYALRSTRAIWTCPDPTANLQIPAFDKQRAKKMRVAQVQEARELLAALPDDVALVYALGFGAGLRRSEAGRAEWPDINWTANKMLVRESKSEAGENRQADVSKLALQYLRAEFARQGFPVEGRIVRRSVISGKNYAQADKAWEAENERRVKRRQPSLKRITPQECRHTYASMLMAAGYTVIEVMGNMGHTDLAATKRYLKKLPQPNQISEADRLHNYEDGFKDARSAGGESGPALELGRSN